MISANNRRIAKNTLMLYVRMFVIMGISLFSFRILLRELGETDYGIYNVVGGVVMLFSFLSSALTQSTQRFLAFHIAKGDEKALREVFSMSVNVHLVMALVVVLLAETIGLWFLNSIMNFPEGSIREVNLVYQCSIATFSIQLCQIPYTSSIIANERMSFYAYFSIAEAALNLSAVLLLVLFAQNKLVIYAVAIVAVAICIFSANRIYCLKHFPSSHYIWHWDKVLFKRLISFSGWNLLGGIGNMGASQGVNLLFNIFLGVGVNAAMGVANQVNAAVASFASKFQTAFNPQIIKYYAANERQEFLNLIFRASRVSFLLVFTIGFPALLCCRAVFDVWLTEIPLYAVPFTQLIIVFCMIDAVSGPLWTAAQASGNIKNYMIIISSMIFLNIPVALTLLWLGISPIYVIGFKVINNLAIHFVRVGYLHKLIAFPSMLYMRKVMKPICLSILLSVPVPLLASHYSDTVLFQAGLGLLTMAECAMIGCIMLLTKSERQVIYTAVLQKLHLRRSNQI